MHALIHSYDHHHILYDRDQYDTIDGSWFERVYWYQRGAVIEEAQGRGTTLMVRHDDDELVLRHYHRGGIMASLMQDRYLGCNLVKSRAWREWRLLAELYEKGLPVPKPVAAHVEQQGLFYRADLIMQRIPNAASLFQHIKASGLADHLWRRIGECIRRFHEQGVYHADLNAHNILLDLNNEVYLIDFDRGRLRRQGAWQQANLKRLYRSLHKLKGQHPDMDFSESDWYCLMQGYGNKQ